MYVRRMVKVDPDVLYREVARQADDLGISHERATLVSALWSNSLYGKKVPLVKSANGLFCGAL